MASHEESKNEETKEDKKPTPYIPTFFKDSNEIDLDLE
jgi:hypothetical protein